MRAGKVLDISKSDILYNNVDALIEEDGEVWNPAKTYQVGDKCNIDDIVYRAAVQNTGEFPPQNLYDASKTPPEGYWEKIGVVNRYRFLDDYISSTTKATYSYTQNNITYFQIRLKIKVYKVNALCLFNLHAERLKVIQRYNGYEVVLYDSFLYDVSKITSWEEYFFSEIIYKNDLLLYLHFINESEVEIIIERPNSPAELGSVVVTSVKWIGELLSEPTLKITDYSKKNITETSIELKQGNYSKYNNYTFLIPAGAIDNVYKFLASLRASKAVFIPTSDMFESMFVYGFYKDFEITVRSSKTAICKIECESLI